MKTAICLWIVLMAGCGSGPVADFDGGPDAGVDAGTVDAGPTLYLDGMTEDELVTTYPNCAGACEAWIEWDGECNRATMDCSTVPECVVWFVEQDDCVSLCGALWGWAETLLDQANPCFGSSDVIYTRCCPIPWCS